jgi:hypothetical protein
LLLSETGEGESALRPRHAFLLGLVVHRTPHLVAREWLLVLRSRTGSSCAMLTTSVPYCTRRAAGMASRCSR